jgi:signal peptidase I
MPTTDNDYKRMMTWVAVAFVVAVVAALVIVHFVMRAYAQ